MKHVRMVSQTPVCAQTPAITLDMIIQFIGLATTVVTSLMSFVQAFADALNDFKGTTTAA